MRPDFSGDAPSSPVRRLWAAMRAQRPRLALAALLGTVAAASSVALLGTSGWLISYAAQLPPVLALSVAAVLVRAFALSRSVFRYAERLVGHDAALRGLTGVRVAVYERLVQLAPVGLARFSRGDLLARLVADVDAALDLPLRVLLPWAQAALVAVATVAFMAWLVPGAGLVVGIVLLVGLTVIPLLVARIAARAEARLAPARGDLSACVVSALEGSGELLAFGAVGRTLDVIAGHDARLTRIARRESAGLGLGVGLSVLLQGAAVIGALVLAVPAVTDGRLPPAFLAVVALLPLAAYDLISPLPTSAIAFQRVSASAKRLAEVLDSPVPVTEPATPLPPPPPPYAISLSGVRARWRTDGPWTLRGVDLHLAAHERIAVVGPSGAGKSTLAAALLKFLDYDGSMTLHAREIRDLDGDEVRQHIGMLTQTAHVFDTTLRDNLRLGRATADDAELHAVLARVRLDAWARELPDGLDTELGVRGAAMSGGERQRLALARLLLADRPLLVLDEPTEYLDPLTADALTADLIDATVGRGLVLITHRLSGLDRLDRIVVLQDGRITQSGRHEQLCVQPGWYAERWQAEREASDLAARTAAIPVGTAVATGA